jgi:rhodanese-related sulfurtransferase
MAGYIEIEADELQQLQHEQNILLVDVRNDDEAGRGIIPGAIHIPLHLLPLNIEQLNNDLPLVFYCHSGMRSAQAAAFMSSKFRGHIYNLRGGILSWGKAGYALVPKQ